MGAGRRRAPRGGLGRRIFVGLCAISTAGCAALAAWTYLAVAGGQRRDFEAQAEAQVASVRGAIAGLDAAAEQVAANALTALRLLDAADQLPATAAGLVGLAARLHVHNIYTTDRQGFITRTGLGHLPPVPQSIFDHCEGYRDLLDAPGDVAHTPLIPSHGSVLSGPFKFSMATRAEGRGLFEVATSAAFVEALLADAVAASPDLEAVSLWTPAGVLLGRAAAGDPRPPAATPASPPGAAPARRWHDGSLHLGLRLPVTRPSCCECQRRDLSAGLPEYAYHLRAQISPRALLAERRALALTLAAALAAVAGALVAVAHVAAARLAHGLARLAGEIETLAGDPAGRGEVSVAGGGEVAAVALHVNRLLAGRRRAEVARQQDERRQQAARLATTVAHDLRSPLAALTLIRPQLRFVDAAGETLFTGALDRMGAIAERLLAGARRPRAAGEATQVVSVAAALGDVLAEKELQACLHAGVTLVTPERESWASLFVAACPTALGCALSNLLDNALDALPHGGCVQVTARARPPWVEVVVRDDGVGIAPELLARLGHEPVHGADPDSHGIGVLSAREAVAAMGGSLQFSSQVESFTEVVISLPQAGPVAAAATRPAAAG